MASNRNHAMAVGPHMAIQSALASADIISSPGMKTQGRGHIHRGIRVMCFVKAP